MKQNKNRLTEMETKWMVTRGEGVGEWVEKVKGNTVNNTVISLHGNS